MTSSSIQKSSSVSAPKSLSEKLDPKEFLSFEPTVSDAEASGISTLFAHFDYVLHTFQYKKTDKNGKNHFPVHVYSEANQALLEAADYNAKGYDVYFMVNEGDGVTPNGKRVPRCQESVKELSKCFIDTDACPIAKVNDYLHTLSLVPHLTVSSSPGRYHLYFNFSPVEKTPENILKWKAVQSMLHRLGDATIKNPSKTLGTDSTMSDYSKLLRVPGFFHIDKRTRVTVTDQQDLPPYTLDELFSLTRAQEYLDYNRSEYGNASGPSNVPDVNGTEIIEAGERFQALQSLSLHLANQPITDSEKFDLFTRFVRCRLDNSDKVYAVGDTLTQKSISLFDSANKKVKREEQAKIELLHKTLEKEPEDASAWTLPDDFYLNAPNGFGDVVRQVMENSLYPCASLAFGTFITGLSIIKSKTHLTPTGASPALYTLNVAPSGYGKNAPMTMLQNLFVSNGLRNIVSNEVRSDRGLYNHLAGAQGTALLILDEIAPLLRSIQQKDASAHLANISKAFLQLYSAGAMKGISFGKVSSSNTTKGEKEIVIDNPMVAICGYTVPSQFYSIFTADSVAEGLFQRFVPIVADVKYVDHNPNADLGAIIKSPLFQSYFDAQELDADGNPLESIQAVNRKRANYTPEAAARFSDLEKEYRHRLIDAAKNPDLSHTSGLYSRIAEQIERMATTLSQDEIDMTTLTYAISFMESRHKAIMAVCEGAIVAGKGGESLKQENIILETIARLCRERETPVVVKNDVFHRVRRHFKNAKEFNQVLDQAEEMGKLVRIPNFRREGSRSGSAATGLKLADVL